MSMLTLIKNQCNYYVKTKYKFNIGFMESEVELVSYDNEKWKIVYEKE